MAHDPLYTASTGQLTPSAGQALKYINTQDNMGATILIPSNLRKVQIH